jgi:PRTRC genetic system ThiF family protein
MGVKQPADTALLDLTYLRAVPVLLPETKTLDLVLAGCGGTGSWLAPTVVRVARTLIQQGKRVRVLFVDPDSVEAGNIFRQNFCDAEVGRPKAVTLMQRLSAAWGVPVEARVEPFDRRMLLSGTVVSLMIGCEDNAAGRRELHESLSDYGTAACRWWLDCGNGYTDGQVSLGSAPTVETLAGAFRLPTVCQQLPSPALVHPNLLEPKPEELAGAVASCEDITARNAQSLTVNQQVAAIAGHYLAELLLAMTLKRFATYFDLVSGSMRSKYITPESLAAVVGADPQTFFEQTQSAGDTEDEVLDQDGDE